MYDRRKLSRRRLWVRVPSRSLLILEEEMEPISWNPISGVPLSWHEVGDMPAMMQRYVEDVLYPTGMQKKTLGERIRWARDSIETAFEILRSFGKIDSYEMVGKTLLTVTYDARTFSRGWRISFILDNMAKELGPSGIVAVREDTI